jgi:hypothetical protein
MRRWLVVATLAIVFASCVSSTGRGVPNPGCDRDPRLLGTWRSQRISQVGPGRMTFSFGCGCVYRSSVLTLFARIREEGNYRVWNGTLVFTRPSGAETRWPFRFEGDHLVIEEHPGESYRYTRTRETACEG